MGFRTHGVGLSVYSFGVGVLSFGGRVRGREVYTSVGGRGDPGSEHCGCGGTGPTTVNEPSPTSTEVTRVS